ncbi:UbiA prenyltransferase family [Xylaria cubensis]|nr:UbiA prenyltransferase family [Xylaria cubensis]
MASPGVSFTALSRYVYSRVAFHAYSIWLFTLSDIKTIVLPQSAFGILSALAETGSGVSMLHSKDIFRIIKRIPRVVLWVWINLLPFAISNQRNPKSVAEDEINKLWRTMLSRRWSYCQATHAMVTFYFVAGITSWHVGGFTWSIHLLILGTWYNNIGGADANAFVRNLINALGYTSFAAGAFEIATDAPLSTVRLLVVPKFGHVPDLETWITVILVIILTTVHIQDMADQKGDALRGRRSLPLQIGDSACRWAIAIFMIFWGSFCPSLWRCRWAGYMISMSLAYIVALRTILFRTVKADSITFKIWNLWILCLYALPMITEARPDPLR